MNSSQVLFRPAATDDAFGMAAVHFASVQGVAPGHYPAAIISSWSPTPDKKRCEWLANLIAQESTICEVATSPTDEVVGFCIAVPGQSKLQALYVHPDHSGLGIGADLLRAVEARCLAAGSETLELNASYNAESFYRGNGYSPLRETSQSLADGTSMGAVLMSKRLASAA